jgi:hypothetical protein
MSQLAQKYTTHSSIFRHQTICESTFLCFSQNQKKRFTTTYPKLYRYFTTNGKGLSNDNVLNPYYLTGFTDAVKKKEFFFNGCFLINIHKRSDVLLGYSVSLSFKIKLHSKDKELLDKIFHFFNLGKIYIRKDGYIEYVVNSIKDIQVIIHHFNNYPLITQKLSDYKIFKLVFEYIKSKKHLTKKGFIEI